MSFVNNREPKHVHMSLKGQVVTFTVSLSQRKATPKPCNGLRDSTLRPECIFYNLGTRVYYRDYFLEERERGPLWQTLLQSGHLISFPVLLLYNSLVSSLSFCFICSNSLSRSYFFSIKFLALCHLNSQVRVRLMINSDFLANVVFKVFKFSSFQVFKTFLVPSFCLTFRHCLFPFVFV